MVGVGARKGVSEAQVLAAVDEALAAAGRARDDVRALATIDLKREEAGILAAAETLGVPVHIIDRERIRVLCRTRCASRDSWKRSREWQQYANRQRCWPAPRRAPRAAKRSRDGVTVALAQDICGSSAWDQADETI